MKTILIAGGSRGIGRSLAKTLSKDYNVIITGKNIDNLYAAYNEIGNNIYYVQYDLLDTENINSMFDEALEKSGSEKIDYLVYSAAVHDVRPVRKFDYHYNLEMFHINFFSFVELAKLFVKQKFNEQYKGKIIAISTMETQIMSSGMSIYTASKSALEAFCVTMAREYAKRNIIINGIRPAYVKTDMAKNAETILPELVEKYPFCFLSPEDVVKVIQYLLSDKADNFTGKFLDINNGYFVK